MLNKSKVPYFFLDLNSDITGCIVSLFNANSTNFVVFAGEKKQQKKRSWCSKNSYNWLLSKHSERA